MIQEFNGDLKVFEKPCIIDIWAEWCGPCKVTGKNLEEFSKKHPEVTIYKIDAEQYPDVAERFEVMSLPTILYLEEEEVFVKHVGLITVKQLEDLLGL